MGYKRNPNAMQEIAEPEGLLTLEVARRSSPRGKGGKIAPHEMRNLSSLAETRH